MLEAWLEALTLSTMMPLVPPGSVTRTADADGVSAGLKSVVPPPQYLLLNDSAGRPKLRLVPTPGEK
jgi:hypothetical protein